MILNASLIPRVGRVNGPRELYLSYAKTPKDNFGWVDSMKYLPMDYYMSDMKIDGRDSIIKGWINVNHWEGIRLRENDRVTHWRPSEFNEIRDKSHTKP